MKLHLPRALRGALLAAFALTCTTPAWAGAWKGNTYVIDAEDVAKETFLLTTANGTADSNGWFLRTTTADDASDIAEGAATATITSLILNKPGTEVEGALYTLNIAGHWQNEAGMFSNLHIGKIMPGAEFSAESPVTVSIQANNTVSLGDLENGSSEVANMADSVILNVSGSLNLNFNDFAGTAAMGDDGNFAFKTVGDDPRSFVSYTGGLADNITGDGIISLQGEVNWASTESGVLWSTSSYDTELPVPTNNVDFSNITLRFQNGYTGYTSTDGDKILVTVMESSTQLYPIETTTTPTASYKSTGFTPQAIGNLQVEDNGTMKETSTDASKAWTLRLTGTFSKPTGAESGNDIILASTKADTSALGVGDFCLHLASDGSLVLHNGHSGWGISTLLSSSQANADADWTQATYDITLSHRYSGGFGWILGVDTTSSSFLSVDIGGANVRTDITTGSSIVVSESSIEVTSNSSMASNTLNNLYSSQPVDAEMTVTLSGDATGSSYWLLNSGVTVEALRSGELTTSTGTPTAMTSTDILRFDNLLTMEDTGGILRSGTEEEPIVTIDNVIEATGNAYVRLAPEAGTTLILTQGNGALNSGRGLIVMGGEGSTVELQGISSGEKKNITVRAGNTLSLAGAGAITINAADNNLDPTSSLLMGGGGSLTYIAKVDDSLNELSNKGGELIIQNAAIANNVTAKTLTITNSEDRLAVAETLTTESIKLGSDPFGSTEMKSAGLNAGTLIATKQVLVGNGSAIEALHATIASLTMAAGAQYLVAENGSVHVTGDTMVGGTMKSANISVTGKDGGWTYNQNLKLTADTLSTNAMSDTHVHVGTAQDGILPLAQDTTPVVLELGTVARSLITGNQDTIISASSFTKGSGIEFSSGRLQLLNTSHDASSSIAHTAAEASISLSNVTLDTGSTIIAGGTTYAVGTSTPGLSLSGTATEGSLTLTKLVVDISNDKVEMENVLLIESSGNSLIDKDNCEVSFYTAPGYVGEIRLDANNDLVYFTINSSDLLMDKIATTANSKAAKSALVENAPQAGGELAALYNTILDTSRLDEATRRSTLEALTSGSVTMLADSQRRGVVNHMNTLRNRIIQMGHSQGVETETAWHAWIEADGSFNDISGDEGAGYEFNTWGGTFGVHADVGNFTFGAAISAAYGELTADSIDNAEGNNDTVTVSAFARHQNHNWVQMAALSYGINELEMERSVQDYKAEGDTSGHTITAYYEAGYAIALGQHGRQVIQPLVSLMLTSAQMDGFTESGTIGNAGLTTEDEDYFYGTLGIGARYQAVLSQDINERISFLEIRAKLVQDFGDDTHEANVRFAGAPGSAFVLQGTEAGSFGFQIGAGVSVPLGQQTTFFADVDADIRDNATSVSGSMGFRVAF